MEYNKFKDWLELSYPSGRTRGNYLNYYLLFRHSGPLTKQSAQDFLLDHNNGTAKSFLLAYSKFKKIDLNLPKRKGREKITLPKHLSEKEVAYLTDHATGDLRVIIKLCYECGLRISEVLSLKRQDLDFINHRVRGLGKGNKEFDMPLTQTLCIQLALLCRDQEFGDKVFRELTYNQTYYRLKQLGRKALSKHITPHMLRHSMGTALRRRGCDLRSIQLFLRHSSLRTIETYTYVTESDYLPFVKEILND